MLGGAGTRKVLSVLSVALHVLSDSVATTGTKTVNANPRAIGAEPWRGAAAGLLTLRS